MTTQEKTNEDRLREQRAQTEELLLKLHDVTGHMLLGPGGIAGRPKWNEALAELRSLCNALLIGVKMETIRDPRSG